MSRILLVALILGLAACGNKAGLQLPPGNAPAPLLGSAAAAKPAAQALEAKTTDVSTSKESAK